MTPVKDHLKNYIRLFLEYIGEDPERQGLLDTPDRVLRSWDTLFSGYSKRPEDVLTVFDADGYDQLILLKDIEMYSTCEHHLITFSGKAHVGYIPDPKGKVVGISKLARLVDIYARRLQIQERLTDQVATAIDRLLNPIGVAVVIEAQHLCMKARGVEKQNSVMVTSSLKGVFLKRDAEGAAARNEFMKLIGM
jgi:GTP cyclohydrolase IA